MTAIVIEPAIRRKKLTLIRIQDAISTWPSLRLQLELAPWNWFKCHLWRDDLTPTIELAVGPFRIEFSANTPLFTLDA